MPEKQEIVPWVGIVCIKERKLLTLRENDKDFDLVPGGKQNPGESDIQTITRETREELGVDVTRDSLDELAYFEERSAHTGQLIGFKLYGGDIESEPDENQLPGKTVSFSYIDSRFEQNGFTAGALLRVLIPKLVEIDLID